MEIFKNGSSKDPGLKTAIWHVGIFMGLAAVTIVALALTYRPVDPCADRDKLSVEKIWACDGVRPQSRR